MCSRFRRSLVTKGAGSAESVMYSSGSSDIGIERKELSTGGLALRDPKLRRKGNMR